MAEETTADPILEPSYADEPKPEAPAEPEPEAKVEEPKVEVKPEPSFARLAPEDIEAIVSKLSGLIPKPEAKAEVKAELEDIVDLDEADFDPKIVQATKALKAKNKALEDRLSKIEAGQTQNAAHGTRTRLSGILSDISPDVAKQFAEDGAYDELLEQVAMQFHHENKFKKLVDEPTRVKRALAALGIEIPTKAAAPDPKKAAMEKAKAEYDAGALGSPTNRDTPKDLSEIVREKSRGWTKHLKESSDPSDAQHAFEPLPG